MNWKLQRIKESVIFLFKRTLPELAKGFVTWTDCRKADLIHIRTNKYVYVIPHTNWRNFVGTSNDIQMLKKKGVFRKNLSFFELRKLAVYVADFPVTPREIKKRKQHEQTMERKLYGRHYDLYRLWWLVLIAFLVLYFLRKYGMLG